MSKWPIFFLRTVRSAERREPAEGKGISERLFGDPKHFVLMGAAYLYLAGFLYAYHLYRFFGIPLSALEISLYTYFIYGYHVLVGHWLGVAGSVLYVVVWLVHPRVSAGHLRDVSAVLLLAIVFPMLVGSAYRVAQTGFTAIRSDEVLARAQLVLTKEAGEAYGGSDSVLRAATDNDRLKLLGQSKEAYYLLYQPLNEQGTAPEGRAMILKIPQSDVRLLITSSPGS